VVGAGVGGVNVVVVVGVLRVVVVVVLERWVVVLERWVVVLERPVVLVVGEGSVVVFDGTVVVVEGAAKGIESDGLASLEMKLTMTPETTPEPTKIVWVSRRTRARRRSRCWGVRE
jgi:hypothetical protein